MIQVGSWTEHQGLNFTRNFTESYSEIVESLQNKTLIVTTIKSPPYSMVTPSEQQMNGNDAFEGFAIDLISEIAEILKFNYTFKWVDDGAYGFRNKETGEWNGLMGELLAQKADLAITDLTITYEREQAVDFSMPFMNLGISILYKKPQKKPPDLFSFLSPLSLDVWIYTAAAYLGVSILLFILARFSPYEWDNPHPCTEEAEVLVNEFSLCNSMWFTIGSLMQQGSDISPKAISTRMVAGMWWFFTLIMISSYTANLAASSQWRGWSHQSSLPRTWPSRPRSSMAVWTLALPELSSGTLRFPRMQGWRRSWSHKSQRCSRGATTRE